jgi:hypothetical protein
MTASRCLPPCSTPSAALFAIEYVRAVMETAKAKPLQMAEMLPGMAAKKVKQLTGGSG